MKIVVLPISDTYSDDAGHLAYFIKCNLPPVDVRILRITLQINRAAAVNLPLMMCKLFKVTLCFLWLPVVGIISSEVAIFARETPDNTSKSEEGWYCFVSYGYIAHLWWNTTCNLLRNSVKQRKRLLPWSHADSQCLQAPKTERSGEAENKDKSLMAAFTK